MSIVRLYGNALINLTKIISIRQEGSNIKFILPLSNYFFGSMMCVADSQIYNLNQKKMHKKK